MDPGVLVLFLLIVVAFGVMLIFGHQAKAETIAEWRAVAEEFGLSFDESDMRLEGSVDDIRVWVHSHMVGSGKSRRQVTDLTSVPSPRLDAQLGPDGVLRRALGLEDIEIGDPSFDDAVRVRGDKARLLSILDDKRRDAIRHGIDLGWSYDEGKWKRRAGGHMRKKLREGVVRTVALARAVSQEKSKTTSSLAQRASSDPIVGVRVKALEMLLSVAPSSSEARSALESAAKDRSSAIRFIAARQLGDPDMLGALAATAEDGVAAEALAILERDHAAHDATQKALDLLRRDIDDRTSALRRAFTSLLGHTSRDWAEPTAVALLGDADEPVRLAAARTLGAIGSISVAVPALVPLREKFLGGALKDAARDAIVRIQSRAGNPDAGRLAVVEADAAGQLAVAEEEA